MQTDDLSRPLKVPDRTRQDAARGRPAMFGAVLAGLIVAGAGGFVLVRGDKFGGEPYALARIDKQIVTGSVAPQPAAGEPAKASGNPDRETAQESEIVSGVRVIRGRGGAAPGSVIITVPDDSKVASIDRRLIEKGRHGPLPKIDPVAGAPRDVFARPFDSAQARGRPLVAIVITGLGIAAATTADASTKLPPEVTFAFAPYGSDLDKQAARAREAGHELLLQAPMEPYGYPNNDSGPHTLLAEGAEAQNIDRLHWVMSRITGYVGVTNFMGAKFTGVRPALKPVLDEISRRGLIFVEDGSGSRSLVQEVASTSGLPVGRGDVQLDGLDKPNEFDAAFARAEQAARSGGSVILFAPALPGTVDRVNRWARALEGRGLVLAPVTAIVGKRRG